MLKMKARPNAARKLRRKICEGGSASPRAMPNPKPRSGSSLIVARFSLASCPEVKIHLQRFSHRLERRFALKPDFKRERALMQQHRQSVRAAGACLDRG